MEYGFFDSLCPILLIGATHILEKAARIFVKLLCFFLVVDEITIELD